MGLGKINAQYGFRLHSKKRGLSWLVISILFADMAMPEEPMALPIFCGGISGRHDSLQINKTALGTRMELFSSKI